MIVNGTPENAFLTFLRRFGSRLLPFAVFLILVGFHSDVRGQSLISDDHPLTLPNVGDFELRIISPSVLEITLINTKAPDPGRVSTWDFVGKDFVPNLPSAAEFAVTKDGQPVTVTSIGFKRRVLSAPEKRDLRIANQFYLTLGSNIADGQQVEVTNPSANLWNSSVHYTALMDALRYSPAIHVNQVGYMPGYPKKAMVGYYLGSLGELNLPAGATFQIIDSLSQLPVYSGALTLRPDEGFSYLPTPYQLVFEADFSSLQASGEYQLVVPGLGSSFPFRIDDGVAAQFTRAFSLGLYHQRCGTDNSLPFTRHTHGRCHYQAAQIPTMDPEFSNTQDVLALVTTDYADNPRHTALRLENVAASLYPFVKQGKIDVSGGHHDAGDYSKYTIDSAGLVHFLVFAADSLPGVGALDNLGLPESGDGKSDILQEAKWEADFLARMQDDDGGFYFLVYPKDRRYENNVLPEDGDPQVVWPKTTAVTAAAVGALAEAGSSPLMKAQFPTEAANYLATAQKGWSFLMNAIARYGKDGSYQKITHYGNEFMHDDELAWAAAAMYAATGDPQYQTKLFEFFPDPNSVDTRRWTWWRLFEGYGCAVRTYAFAARSGRLPVRKLDPAYLAKCEAEIILTANDHTRFSSQTAYGTSFPDVTKQYRSPGWYFSSERAFDITVAYQIQPRAEYRNAIVANFNYEGGCNPLNMTFVTGIGYKRQREIVSQYAWNDRRILPPSGLPQGNIRAGYGYLETYLSPGTTYNELPNLSFPSDVADASPYPYYDRWTDMIDTTSEFVVMDLGRSLASLSFWMAQGPEKTQSWKPVLGQIAGLDTPIVADSPSTLKLTAPGVDLSEAQVLWEVRYLEPAFGNPVSITPKFSGDHWIEAEAVLPDGRRVFAASNFVAGAGLDVPPNNYQSSEVSPAPDTVALYHLDGSLADSTGRNAPLVLEGNTHIDTSNVAWMSPRSGGALRFLDLNDRATVKIPSALLRTSNTSEVIVEGMVYVNEFKAYARSVATIFALIEAYNDSYLEFREDKYLGPVVQGGNVFSFGGTSLANALTKKQWHHISLSISQSGYTFSLDGVVQASLASGELKNWGSGTTATLVLGNFDGWIDEIVVRNAGGGLPPISGSAPPNVVLDTAFLDGTTYQFPVTLPLFASASADVGISKVEFFAGTNKIGEDLLPPYTFNWAVPNPGKYAITAKATDLLGQVTTSVSATATIYGSGPIPATLAPIGRSTDGFRLLVTGPAGSSYLMQLSQNGLNWTDVRTITLPGGSAEFLDTSNGSAHRFYRAVLQ